MDNIYIYHGSLDGWYRAQLSNVPKPSTKNNNNELYIMTLVVFMMSEIRYWSRRCADLAWHRMAIAIMPMALIVCVCVRVCSNVFFLASHIHGVMSQVWNVPMFGVVNACIPIVKLKNLVIKTTIMSGGKCQYEWYNFHSIETALEIKINSMWCVAIEMITNKTARKNEQEMGQKSSANYFRGLHCKWYAIYTRKRFYLWLKWWRLGEVCKEREKAMGDRMCDSSNGHGAYFLTHRTAKPSNNLIFYQYLLNSLSRLSD